MEMLLPMPKINRTYLTIIRPALQGTQGERFKGLVVSGWMGMKGQESSPLPKYHGCAALKDYFISSLGMGRPHGDGKILQEPGFRMQPGYWIG